MSTSQVPVSEGFVPFSVAGAPGSQCQTWYKVYGTLPSSNSSVAETTAAVHPRPLVILHGGPGACHNYMLGVSGLTAAPHSFGCVILYDQLGNGNSTHLRDRRLDTAFWTPELFMAELDNLLRHLGVDASYDLLGHSWGGMLGAMFALSAHPSVAGLRRLVISNSPCSMELWVQASDRLRRGLPREVDEVLERHERAQTYDDPEYETAVLEFYKRHLCRVFPFPKDVQDTLGWLKTDDTVYFTM